MFCLRRVSFPIGKISTSFVNSSECNAVFRKFTVFKISYSVSPSVKTAFGKPRILSNLSDRWYCSNRFVEIETSTEKDADDVLSGPVHEEFQKIFRHPDEGHQLLLVQPRLKQGPRRETKEAAELKMAEAVALVETLPGWKVVGKCMISVTSLDAAYIFGKGNLNLLKDLKSKNPRISGIFIGIDMLTALQDTKLAEFFKVEIFDRYQIVLRIFHDHARTKEAKLQIALAEIPYFRVKLTGSAYAHKYDILPQIVRAGGDGESIMERRRRILSEREMKIKRALEKLRLQRQKLRQSERRTSLPVIAVVGYTNCGKTTLIRSLTQDESLIPEDKLFATLDVTLHAGLLPSSQKVLYIDTVGFISDVPTDLIASFKSTLEDVALADVIIHIRDISHPDTEAQKKVVLQTLHSLELSSKLLDTIVEVGNKADLLGNSVDTIGEDLLLISATKGTNLDQLVSKVEETIFLNTSHGVQFFRIPNGGSEYSWLYREAAIKDARADETDPNFLIVETVISSANLAKFKHRFGDLTISEKN